MAGLVPAIHVFALM